MAGSLILGIAATLDSEVPAGIAKYDGVGLVGLGGIGGGGVVGGCI